MVWVKVCGMTDIGEALAVSALAPDALGLILSTESRRRVSLDKAQKIIAAVRNKFTCNAPDMAGVFVNEDTDYIKGAAQKLKLDMVQLSGDESAEYLLNIRQIGDFEIIKAIPCRAGKDICSQINEYKNIPDYYLLDAYSPDSYGGTGKTFDWGMMGRLKGKGNIILAGGLCPENVDAALSQAAPFGLDVSSGLEGPHGLKDISRVKLFLEKARNNQGRDKR